MRKFTAETLQKTLTMLQDLRRKVTDPFKAEKVNALNVAIQLVRDEIEEETNV